MTLYRIFMLFLIVSVFSVKAEDVIGTAVEQYTASVDAEKKQSNAKLKEMKDVLLSVLNKELKAAASRGDLATAQRAEEEIKKVADSADRKPTPIFPPIRPQPADTAKASSPPATPRLEGGLLLTEYPRLKVQDKVQFVPIAQLGEPIGNTSNISSFTKWQYDGNRNQVATGFLKIEKQGEYAFKVSNWGCSMSLSLNGKEVIKYGEQRIYRLTLDPGLIPITIAAYVAYYSDGNTSITLQWQPPGERELIAIPPERFFHAALPTKSP